MEQVLYKLPDGWKRVCVDDVCTKITDGAHKTPKYTDDGVPFLSVKDVNKGLIDFSNTRFVSQETHDDLYKRCNPERNDILYTKVGSTGVAKIVDTDREFSLFVSVALLKPKSELIDSKYFEYALNSPESYAQAQALTRGVANRNLVLKDIKSITFNLAPIKEQKRIVEKLDALLTRIDTAIEHLQESVALADALFESSQSEIFNDVLSNYQHSTIDEICIVTSSKRIFKADYVESGIPFYRTKEIVDLSKEKNISTELFIDKEKFSEICGKFGAPKKGDLLFSAVGTIGVMWIVDEREFYFKDGNLLWLKDMNGVTPEYLKSAISAVLTEKIKDRSQGAAYKAISITNLKAFEIPLPSIEEQKSIVAKIEHVSSVTKKTKQELSLQINDLHNLKASILDSAFKGEL
jgi:type I restriction enzyme S subunit